MPGKMRKTDKVNSDYYGELPSLGFINCDNLVILLTKK